jgi:hypothetical protein
MERKAVELQPLSSKPAAGSAAPVAPDAKLKAYLIQAEAENQREPPFNEFDTAPELKRAAQLQQSITEFVNKKMQEFQTMQPQRST